MSTIFGEEHFFDKSMISIIEERGNAIDNFIYDEIAGVAKYGLPMPKIIINKEKVKKWLILCGQLENLEHSELIDIATKKKFADKDNEIQELKELLSMERSIRKIEAQKYDKEAHDKERYKARICELENKIDKLERFKRSGVPLECFLKALLDGFYYIDLEDKEIYWSSNRWVFIGNGWSDHFIRTRPHHPGDAHIFDWKQDKVVALKDFGKAWALDRETLEPILKKIKEGDNG